MILSCPEDIGEDLSCMVLNGMPYPPLLTFAAHKAPPLIDLGCLHLVDDDLTLRRIKRLEQSFIGLLDERLFFLMVSMTVVGLTPKTRAVSRIPLPLSALSTIRGFTAGRRPWFWYCRRKMCRGPSVVLHR